MVGFGMGLVGRGSMLAVGERVEGLGGAGICSAL